MKAAKTMVRCRDGCGDYGIQELEYICVDCDTRRRLHQVKPATVVSEPLPCKPIPRPSGKDAWHAFQALGREQDAAVVRAEVATFEETFANARQISTALKHYMLATNSQEEVDNSVWIQHSQGKKKGLA
ncbi:hypothetical protein H257_08415 [Aphanomyces astaci]|uniref:A20-type domain-containing protein n=1 Tax=Aphanomyces astaci TaxID=112090 RepID=W4GH03_APHAT|nr:hypothetical protein H257_08415 [Aphanomyces astaci]ETV78238.1 hypothetical protein H257_08415 [Aphanomyces astaci]|eukprot:XP_009832575.1 hypothetical protein H257_08415 [Aphanomyces astaci]